MISCIICSRDKNLLAAISHNIEQTIGVPFEIIAIDNSKENNAISKVYNNAATLARYEFLVFVHEDVIFHTANWGVLLADYFARHINIGCVGVAGGTYKTKAPSHWVSLVTDYNYLDQSYLIQHYKEGGQQLRDTWSDKNTAIQEVVLMDGVFLAFDKRHGIRFDESIEGFHGYDLSVCLDAINKGYQNIITREILVEHLSSGSFNSQWIKAIHTFHKKNASYFPLGKVAAGMNASDLEKKTMARFVELSFLSGQRKIGLYWWAKLFFSTPFFNKHLYLAKVFLAHFKKRNAADA